VDSRVLGGVAFVQPLCPDLQNVDGVEAQVEAPEAITAPGTKNRFLSRLESLKHPYNKVTETFHDNEYPRNLCQMQPYFYLDKSKERSGLINRREASGLKIIYLL